jgi:simple sugar transport system permease protein
VVPVEHTSVKSESTQARGAKARANLLRDLLRAPEFGAVAAAVVLYAFFAIVGGGYGFVSVAGTASWLNTASELGLIAVPVGLLMIAGDFDLSIGSMVGVGSITVGLLTGYLHQPLELSIAVAATVAVAVGLGNGLLVTRTGLPSFIVTLAANLIMAGLGLAVSKAVANTTSITVMATGFSASLLDSKWGMFDISILWWVLAAAVAAWVLIQTRAGSWISATGGDAERARRAGVMTSRVKIVLFVCTSLAATFVGAMQAVEYHTGDPTTGQGYVFEAPIVVVIGGVLLTGGYGSIIGVVVGTVIYGVVNAGLFYTGWNTDYAQVIIGTLMVVAVITNTFLRKLAMRAVRSMKAR